MNLINNKISTYKEFIKICSSIMYVIQLSYDRFVFPYLAFRYFLTGYPSQRSKYKIFPFGNGITFIMNI